jgi:hypothetical protein
MQLNFLMGYDHQIWQTFVAIFINYFFANLKFCIISPRKETATQHLPTLGMARWKETPTLKMRWGEEPHSIHLVGKVKYLHFLVMVSVGSGLWRWKNGELHESTFFHRFFKCIKMYEKMLIHEVLANLWQW